MRPPYGSRVTSTVIDGTITVLAVAIALHVAVDLLTAIVPQLLIIGSIVVVITAAISIAKYRQSRW